MKEHVVIAVPKCFLLFLRNLGIGFHSIADIQKLGFRLDFLLRVALNSVHAISLMNSLDSSKYALKTSYRFSSLKTKGFHPARRE